MAVVVKHNQVEDTELICGVSNDCVMLEPAKLEPEPVNFISVQNGIYETDLYTEHTYQTLTPYQSQFSTNNTPQLESATVAVETDEMVERANTEISDHSSSTLSVPVQDYYEIQVAEEEVVSDNWNVDHTEVVVENSKPMKAEKLDDDLEIPLPENQDMYSHLHPYPCDFCSRRFSHKSSLMSHMISHQTERPHGCNLCGARYRRKNELVSHMKIHALPPARNHLDDDGGGGDHAKNRRKKAQSLAPKRNNSFSSSEFNEFLEFKEEKKPVKNRLMKRGHKSLPSKMKSHIDDDLRMLAELSRNSDLLSEEPRWPVIDQSRPYVCQHCGVGFAREKALASHSRIHGGDSPFECTVCGEMFWSVVLLREHCRCKHPHLENSPGPADPGTPTDEYAGDDRFGTFFCETCGISFYRLDLLRKHRRCHFKIEEPLQEVGDDDHVCMVCGQFFENASELRIHTETHLDSPEPQHRCVVCGASFNDAGELSEHVRTNHTDLATDNTCTLCGKVCKDRRTLAKHTCLQAENRSFPCYSCNKRFHSRARLRRHMVSHRDKAVSCSDCGEEFPDGRALMSHRHSHNSSNHPARSFPCHDCGKTFGSRSSQQIHVRIHTGERPYGCHYCWKAFADGGTLRKHERIHTGEKPYVCPVCPKAFNQRVVLREHIRAHHSGSDSKVNSCYECKVCGYLFSSSSELCVHLVQHSDENTAKHRLPNMGPRKYKRRRKLGVPSPVKAPPSPPRDFESTDSSDSMIESKPAKKIAKKKFDYDSPSPNRELERSVVESFESAIDNIQSIVKIEPKKSKIDKLLMKKHKTKALSKLTKMARIEKRAKAAKLLNNTSYASKYVVSRPEEKLLDAQNRPRTKNVTYPSLEDSLETILNGSDAFRNRPRTKNVNYHNLKPTKLEPATFPLKGSKSKKTRENKKRAYVKKEKSKYLTSVNGSKSSELEESYVSEEKLETCIVDDFNIEGVHAEVKPEDMPLLMEEKIESVMIKSEILTCEMCGDGFADRSELLAHIRIHI